MTQDVPPALKALLRASRGAAPVGTAQPRERILAGMIGAVGDKGYRATTVADVCQRVGVSRATFYEHFDDKEECFLAVVDTLGDLMVAYVRAAIEGRDGFEDSVRAGLAAMLDALAVNDDAARVSVVEAQAAGARSRARYQRAVYEFVALLDQARRLSPGGDDLPGLTSKAAVSSIAAAVFSEVAAGRIRELPTLLPDLVYLALVPFAGHDGALAAREGTSSPARPEEAL